jgi:hypothetical protein
MWTGENLLPIRAAGGQSTTTERGAEGRKETDRSNVSIWKK